jgi:thiol-disulfide isomerase/thioredoxin
MQNFITVLKAEHIKKKGTGIYVLGIILGAIAPFINLLVSLTNNFSPRSGGIPVNYYIKNIENSLEAFTIFFFPLFIIIMVSRITQLDHKYGGWQLMETQPMKKSQIYFSKFSVALIANFMSIISMIIAGLLSGLLLVAIKGMPEHATAPFDFVLILNIIVRLFLAGLVFTAFQYMISVILPSFIWSILVGFAVLIAYLFLGAFTVTVPDWYPMEMLNKISLYAEGSDLGYFITYSETAGFILSLLILYLGFEWYNHKTLKSAFFGNGLRTAKAVIAIVVLGGLTWFMLTPNVNEPFGKTVVSGKIEGSQKFNSIYLLDNFIFDTIAVIPIKDNKFSYTLKKDIPLDRYMLNFNGQRVQVILGNKDSIFIDIKLYKADNSLKVTGTRAAENKQNKKTAEPWSYVSYNLEQNEGLDNPKEFTKTLIDEWKEMTTETNKFKTVDNYVPREDYLTYKRKLITIEYLNFWNTFLKKRAVMYPNEKTVATPEINAMIKTVPLDDAGMLSNESYFTYVRSKMISDNTSDLDENTKTLQAIAKLKPGTFKDRMLYWQLEKSIKEASSTEERNKLSDEYAATFTNNRYTLILNNKKRILESLTKGNASPAFVAVDMNNKPVTLANLKGKFVAIDTWATWCAPCRMQSPYFEKTAIKYKNENIQFIAISVDQNFGNWLVSAKEKSKSVMQLHVNDIDKFYTDYNIEGIPRFILIGPDGTMVNSQMPYADQPAFEETIRTALSLPEQK